MADIQNADDSPQFYSTVSALQPTQADEQWLLQTVLEEGPTEAMITWVTNYVNGEAAKYLLLSSGVHANVVLGQVLSQAGL